MRKTIVLKRLWMISVIALIGLLLTFSTASAYTLATARVEYRDYNNPSSSHTRVPILFTAEHQYNDVNLQ